MPPTPTPGPARPVALFLLTALSLLMSGCGGGGGGDGGGDDGGTPPPGTAEVRIAIGDVTVIEGDGSPARLSFPVTLDGVATETVTVRYTTVAITAAAGTDFTPAGGSLEFPPGTTFRALEVAVTDDDAEESDETLLVRLTQQSANAALADAEAVGTIRDDDGAVPPAPVIGLDARPANPDCVAPARPTGDATVATEDPFPTAPAFSAPTKLLQAPGDASRWFVLQKAGLVRVFSTANPAAVSTWLNLSAQVDANGEGGLLGLAFHPNFPATPEVYVSYTGPGSPMVSKISRVILDSTTQPVNVTEQLLLTIDQPFTNHNGGDIAFGPDGSLYIGIGDGGSGGDPNDYAQNTRRLLGKMLRIDVLGVAFPSPGYGIPTDNPFAANPRCGPGSNAQACPEIYAWGLRNPWRWSFDGPTGALWAGDVGQDAFEEVDVIVRGGNYGWRCREGFADFNTAGCAASGFVEPLVQYSHAAGDTSITGGFVYRGNTLPGLQGRYVFGDFSSGRLWALASDNQGGYLADELADTPYNVSSFGLSVDGELYFTDFSSGRIRRLIAAGPAVPDTIPASLADTGCVDAGNPTLPASGTIPYGLNAPFWSDGADKTRYLALPDGSSITAGADGDWQLPNGTVLVKNFALAGKPVETRLLMRHPDGVWAGYTYEWNDAGTAATRVIGGKTRQVSGQAWIYPSEGECLACHTQAAGFALGLETAQQNRSFFYASTGRTAPQVATLAAIGVLGGTLPEPLPALPDPADAGQPLAARARAYLHTNCAQCHRPGGPTPSSMDLRYTTALANTGVCNAPPQAGDLGLANARIVAPGDAARSVLVNRAGRRDAAGMPPLGSSLPDTAGVALLSAWVNSLAGCS